MNGTPLSIMIITITSAAIGCCILICAICMCRAHVREELVDNIQEDAVEMQGRGRNYRMT